MGDLGYIHHFSNLKVSFLLSFWPTQVEFLDLDDLNAETRSSGNSMLLGSENIQLCSGVKPLTSSSKCSGIEISKHKRRKIYTSWKLINRLIQKFASLFRFIFFAVYSDYICNDQTERRFVYLIWNPRDLRERRYWSMSKFLSLWISENSCLIAALPLKTSGKICWIINNTVTHCPISLNLI